MDKLWVESSSTCSFIRIYKKIILNPISNAGSNFNPHRTHTHRVHVYLFTLMIHTLLIYTVTKSIKKINQNNYYK